ncbi:hypothetical protein KCP73_17395 [Salmonella enterica subsp. enterica]|nr:hypothetical protein KCP73_17395 [Salmonella enterica subsp. enterica]
MWPGDYQRPPAVPAGRINPGSRQNRRCIPNCLKKLLPQRCADPFTATGCVATSYQNVCVGTQSRYVSARTKWFSFAVNERRRRNHINQQYAGV